jgi:DNA mismatch repair protein MSH2
VAETERPIGFGCIECLISVLSLSSSSGENRAGTYTVELASLESFMRLDSAAAEAVNLLPKADHPSQFGSLYGVLNRCKTKMGSRVLDRWLRQPLVDDVEINKRLDIVELLTNSALLRGKLVDEGLKAIPDLDSIISK